MLRIGSILYQPSKHRYWTCEEGNNNYARDNFLITKIKIGKLQGTKKVESYHSVEFLNDSIKDRTLIIICL